MRVCTGQPREGRFGPCRQGFGRVITEPSLGWAKNALQEYESLYIGGAKSADVRSGPGTDRTESTRRRKLNDHDGSYRLRDVLRVVSWGRDQWNKHEVER